MGSVGIPNPPSCPSTHPYLYLSARILVDSRQMGHDGLLGGELLVSDATVSDYKVRSLFYTPPPEFDAPPDSHMSLMR